MKPELGKLAAASRALGADPAYAQGGGGNTSVKLDGRVMAVKASGCALKDMGTEEDFVLLDYPRLRQYMQAPDVDEAAFNAAIASCRIEVSEAARRPSIEASLHALMPAKVVLHTHTVYAMVPACCAEGREIIAGALESAGIGEAAWLEYATPGRALALALTESLPRGGPHEIVFCANHGLIVSAESAPEALALHTHVNAALRAALDLPDFDADAPLPDVDAARNFPLFPDLVVYTQGGGPVNSSAGRETLAAWGYVHRALVARKLTPVAIPVTMTEELLRMESEKYRMSVAE